MKIEYNGIEVMIKMTGSEYSSRIGELLKPNNLREDDPTTMYRLVKEVVQVVAEFYNLDNVVEKATITTKHFTMEYIHTDRIYVYILNQHTQVDTLSF